MSKGIYDISEDVDMIYDKVYRRIVENVELSSDELSMYATSLYIEINSDVFTSKDGRSGNESQPIKLMCSVNSYREDSSYTTGASKEDIAINISPTLQYMVDSKSDSIGDYMALRYSASSYDVDCLLNKQNKLKFTEQGIKTTIAHELSHWLDDALHNKMLYHRTQKTKLANICLIGHILNCGKPHRYMNDTEVNAMFTSIYELKRLKEKEWDDFTLTDLYCEVDRYNIMKDICQTLKRKDYINFEKTIIRRLVREGLLGKNMRGFSSLIHNKGVSSLPTTTSITYVKMDQ